MKDWMKQNDLSWLMLAELGIAILMGLRWLRTTST
jgi:hypothetical protein